MKIINLNTLIEEVLPNVTTAGCVVINNNNILIIYVDRKGKKRIELPKGRIDLDETPSEAAKRETYEETGIECTIVNYKPYVIKSTAFYLAKPIGGLLNQTNKAENKIIKSKWKPINKVIKKMSKSNFWQLPAIKFFSK